MAPGLFAFVPVDNAAIFGDTLRRSFITPPLALILKAAQPPKGHWPPPAAGELLSRREKRIPEEFRGSFREAAISGSLDLDLLRRLLSLGLFRHFA
jgi:hypothetical protein